MTAEATWECECGSTEWCDADTSHSSDNCSEDEQHTFTNLTDMFTVIWDFFVIQGSYRLYKGLMDFCLFLPLPLFHHFSISMYERC